MSMYKITIEGAKDNKPEFNPDEELANGTDADGFLLVTFRNGEPYAMSVCHITVMQLASMIAERGRDEASSIIRQAVAISEGLKKAEEIREEDDRRRAAKNLADLLRMK